MSETEFESFAKLSQSNYASCLSKVEGASLEQGLKKASEQFTRLVPNGFTTSGQLFFEVVDAHSEESLGYLWLGFQERFGKTLASINDIYIREEHRGRGFGKEVLRLSEQEAKKAGANRIRLHVFAGNQVARNLYEKVGFLVTDLDMSKNI